MSDVSQADCAATENADNMYPLTKMLRDLVLLSEANAKRVRTHLIGDGANERATETIPFGERVMILRRKLGLSEQRVMNLMRGQVRQSNPKAESQFLDACCIPKVREWCTNALAPSMVRELHVVKLKATRQSGHTMAICNLATEHDWVVVIDSVYSMNDYRFAKPYYISVAHFGEIIKEMAAKGLNWCDDSTEGPTAPKRIFLDDAAVMYEKRIRRDEVYKQIGRCFQTVPTLVEVG